MSEETDIQDPAIEELCRIKADYVDATLRWYSEHNTWPRLFFRGAGIVIIVSSLSIPFLAAAGGRVQSIGVPIGALAIAVVTALNSFFGWKAVWEKRIRGELTLEGLIAVWETKMADSRRTSDAELRYAKALQATEEIIDATRVLVATGTDTYFANLTFPQMPQTQSQAQTKNAP